MMMQGLRKAGESWLGKLIVGVMFSVLIASFAIWGIGDIFRGRVSTTAASVGKAEITQEQLRIAYQNEVQRLSRQVRRPITTEMARSIGLDQQVLSRLVTEATLDQSAKQMNLAVSDATVAQSIFADPAFKGPTGAFDRTQFNAVLSNAGLNEALFIREQRGTMQRQQLAELLAGGVTAPLAVELAAHRYRSEQRAISYAQLSPAAAGQVPAPEEAALRSYYTERKGSFRAPEYRSANVLVLTADKITEAGAITDEEARKRYDQVKETRFGSAEKRTIQQISFPKEADAAAALARIRAGASFEDIAKERNIADKDLTLGSFTKAAIFDKTVGEAAYGLGLNAVSDVVAGSFGPVLLRVTAIEPGGVKPFEQVAGEVKQELALERARNALIETHDAIEDQRASAKPLVDIAQDRKLALTVVGPMDAQMRDKAGKAIADVPALQELASALFRTEIGADNEAIRLSNGGYVWFDLTGIEPGRERPFEEVKDQVSAQWLADETASRLAKFARELSARIEKGEAFEAVAASAGAVVAKAADLTRQTNRPELPAPVINAVFGTPVGKVDSALVSDSAGRILFKVESAQVPPYVRTTQEAEGIARQLGVALGDDLLSAFVRKQQNDLGTSVNPQVVRNAIGGEN